MSMTSCFFCFFIKKQKKQEAPLNLLFFKKKQEVSPKKQEVSCFLKLAILRVNLYHEILNDIHTWNINVTWFPVKAFW